ncbi:Crp/Fnr family transcriptional regulator [Rhodococcus sp. H36-A4]|uniref:Crp/Fnr family transcriptional regulator n=1 Tax=Rhodococcus sp. H36-A4 TaxID=3004353 RepID=UPI0022AF9479|nr:Crp/Fnr family transcriptional regulator [Rhodococcus sp. H36-A4]MCZ4077540.1 Crp/Fnr family transcriptional regulator [Rhodococcus sp. H36-A4]
MFDSGIEDRAWLPDVMGSELFAGFTVEEITMVTECLGARLISFDHGQVLMRGNSQTNVVGLVIDGSVFASTIDGKGVRNLVSAVEAQDVFAEDMLAHELHHTENTVTGAIPGRALFLGMDKIVRAPGPLCHLRSRVVENLFRVMSTKNRMLHEKLSMVSRKSLRERIVLFLGDQQERTASSQFTVIFSRAELADYLNVDRTALSRELMRMKHEGLIDFYRNSFSIKLPLTAATM